MPLLPHRHLARVDDSKAVYLLTPRTHGDKSKWFEQHGFSLAEKEKLIAALLDHADYAPVDESRVQEEETIRHGLRVVLYGRLRTPSGREPMLYTVWQFDVNEPEVPRLITAVPQLARPKQK